MTEFIKVLDYYNYYSKKDESIDIKFTIEDGFFTKEDALRAIAECGQNEEEFSFVIFNKMYYPVSICNTSQQIVIAKDYIWYKEYSYGGIKKYDRDKEPFYIIENARAHSLWTYTMVDIFREYAELDCEVAKKVKAKSYMKNNCMIAFCCAMFNTMIPVYQLNSVDIFFGDYPPSRMKLWENGIRTFNPFSEDRIYYIRGTTYTYEDFLSGK